MTRIEELTLDVLDGTATELDREEIAGEVTRDPYALHVHLGLLELDAALRESVAPADRVPGVLAAIRSTLGNAPGRARARTLAFPRRTPLSRVRRRSPRGERNRASRASVRRWGRPASLPLVLAVAILAAAGVFLALRTTDDSPRAVVARISETTGGVIIQRDAREIAAGRGAPLEPGDRIDVPAGARAGLAYPDGKRVELGSGVYRLERAAEGEGAPAVLVPEGEAYASVTGDGEPVVLRTPHASVSTGSAVLRIHASRASTRIEVLHGRAWARGREGGAAVEVPAGHAVVAAPGLPLKAASTRGGHAPSEGTRRHHPHESRGEHAPHEEERHPHHAESSRSETHGQHGADPSGRHRPSGAEAPGPHQEPTTEH